jgi:hypothetical protein
MKSRRSPGLLQLAMMNNEGAVMNLYHLINPGGLCHDETIHHSSFMIAPVITK